jgi:hypothetical protein
MNILCVDYPLAGTLGSLGHKVLSLRLEPGIARLADALESGAEAPFKPDLFIQQERLGPRVILDGVQRLPCPTLFISIDAHLNLFWQKYYAGLFDLTLTAHLSRFAEESDDFGRKGRYARNVRRLRHYGYARAWRDFNGREHDFSFCGVVDEHRPIRKAALELLSRHFNLHRPEKTLPHQEMLELFSNTRIVPNESIAREVNFRVFEGASCGCLVLGQNVGEDQNVCFTPGRELVLYEHGLDLLDKAAFYQKNKSAAEKIARAAWLRVQAEHLPERRAKELLDLAEKWSVGGAGAGGRAVGAEADEYYYLALQQLYAHGSHVLNPKWLLKRFLELPEKGEVVAAALRALTLLDEASIRDGLGLCAEVLRENLYVSSLSCNLAGSVFCRRHGAVRDSELFLKRQERAARGENNTDGSSGIVEGARGADLSGFYLAWASLLYKQKKLARPGCRFDPGAGFLPESALECLFLAQSAMESGARVSTENKSLMEQMHLVFSALPGYACLDMGALAHLSLYEQNNWRLQAQFGLSELNCLKVEAGLDELAAAFGKAESQGEAPEFFRLLSGVPASESILRALKLPGCTW